jgi:hypothetical protein
MSKGWWRLLLDEGAIPALALAFAVGQSPWGSVEFRNRLFTFQSQKDESPTAGGPVFPTVDWWAGEAPAAGGSLTVVRPVNGRQAGREAARVLP